MSVSTIFFRNSLGSWQKIHVHFSEIIDSGKNAFNDIGIVINPNEYFVGILKLALKDYLRIEFAMKFSEFVAVFIHCLFLQQKWCYKLPCWWTLELDQWERLRKIFRTLLDGSA